MKALGLIETIGLVTAFEAADAALKAANVKLLGYENTKGGGRITVKFVGDVGAVKAGVTAGVAAALRIGRIESSLVIPRPHQEIEGLIAQIDRGPAQAIDPAASLPPAPDPVLAVAEASKPTAAKPKAKPAADKAGKPKPVAKPKSTAGKAKRPSGQPLPPPPAEVVDVIEPAADATGAPIEDTPPPAEAAVE